jgi:hypothetical protein
MVRRVSAASAVLFSAILIATSAPAQNLTITNVRIIGPDASIIERGSIVPIPGPTAQEIVNGVRLGEEAGFMAR